MDRGYYTALKSAKLLENAQYITGLQAFYDDYVTPKKPIVVLHQDDVICLRDQGLEMLPKHRRNVPSIDLIEQKIQQYSKTQFVLIHNVTNYNSKINNLKTVQWKNNWCNYNLDQYIPVTNKSLNKSYHWLTLNNNVRLHRHLSCMYALGLNLESTGYIKFDPTGILFHNSWNTYLDYWKFNERNEIFSVKEKFPAFESGFNKIKTSTGYVTRSYTDIPMDTNFENFNNNLSPLYKNTTVEIVNETHWHPERGGIISEKYFNTVFGYNFPILISTSNSLQCIRNSGFDVFDDVLNNNYDTIEDPFVRLTTAIEDNIKLFTDRKYAIDMWHACQDRFNNNVQQTLQNEKNKYQEFCTLIESILNDYEI